MPSCALYLVTYDRGTYDLTGKTKPYHWLYFIEVEHRGNQNQGIAHQLRGMPGGFYYSGPEEVDLAESGPLKEKVEVGEVDTSMMDRIHEILKGVPINQVEHLPWNCQDWAMEGFERLKVEGFVYDYLTEEALRSWLKEK